MLFVVNNLSTVLFSKDLIKVPLSLLRKYFNDNFFALTKDEVLELYTDSMDIQIVRCKSIDFIYTIFFQSICTIIKGTTICNNVINPYTKSVRLKMNYLPNARMDRIHERDEVFT